MIANGHESNGVQGSRSLEDKRKHGVAVPHTFFHNVRLLQILLIVPHLEASDTQPPYSRAGFRTRVDGSVDVQKGSGYAWIPEPMHGKNTLQNANNIPRSEGSISHKEHG